MGMQTSLGCVVDDVLLKVHELGFQKGLLVALQAVQRALKPHGGAKRNELEIVDIQIECEGSPSHQAA